MGDAEQEQGRDDAALRAPSPGQLAAEEAMAMQVEQPPLAATTTVVQAPAKEPTVPRRSVRLLNLLDGPRWDCVERAAKCKARMAISALRPLPLAAPLGAQLPLPSGPRSSATSPP